MSLPATGLTTASPVPNQETDAESRQPVISGAPEPDPEPEPEPATHNVIVSVKATYGGNHVLWKYDQLGVLAGDSLEVSAKAKTGYEILNASWNVTGPAEISHRTENGSVATISFSDAGKATLDATASLRDTDRNRTTKWSSIQYTIVVSRRDPSLNHFEVTFDGSPSRLERAGVLAHVTTRLERLYANFSQRLSLPEEVSLEYTTGSRITGRCGDAYACVTSRSGEATSYMPYDWMTYSWAVIDQTYRHELTHVSQAEKIKLNNGYDWDFITKGHAEYEGSHQFRTPELTEKPTKESLFNFNGKYDASSLFVNAFIARYGYGTFEEFIQGSQYKSVEDAFDEYTNESFDSFYEVWAPINSAEGPNSVRWKRPSNPADKLGWKPRFVYRNGTLQTLGTPAKYDYGNPVNVTWDVNGDGTAEYNGTSADWTPEQVGEYAVQVTYAHGNESLSRTQSVSVSSVPLDPTNPDNDGVYEDVNGDGEVSVTEVQALFANQNSKYVKIIRSSLTSVATVNLVF